jgi:hypothetical protein
MKQAVYGILAEFDDHQRLIEAARRCREEGYTRVEAYSPFPVEGLAEATGFRRTRLPLVVLLGGIVGGAGAFFMQYYANVFDYPLNIGGRPYNSWPSFIPITFELTVLGAALAAVWGMLALNGLPMPHHPLFSSPHFDRATRDRFFVCIKARDPRFDRGSTRRFLESLTPRSVEEVSW